MNTGWWGIDIHGCYSLMEISFVPMCTCKNNRRIWRHNASLRTSQINRGDVTMLKQEIPFLGRWQKERSMLVFIIILFFDSQILLLCQVQSMVIFHWHSLEPFKTCKGLSEVIYQRSLCILTDIYDGNPSAGRTVFYTETALLCAFSF